MAVSRHPTAVGVLCTFVPRFTSPCLTTLFLVKVSDLILWVSSKFYRPVPVHNDGSDLRRLPDSTILPVSTVRRERPECES